MTLDAAASPDCRRFTLRFAADERHATELCWTPTCSELLLDRNRSGSRRDIPHIRRIPAAPQDGKLTLRLVLDGECAELFINGGERTMAIRLETPAEAKGIIFTAEGPLQMEITHHQLG